MGDCDRAGAARRADRRRELRAGPHREAGRAAGRPRPGPRQSAPARRDRVALLAPAARLGDGAALRPDRHLRHRLGQEPRLQPAGARRDRAAAEVAGALPLPDQGAGPGPGAQARPAAAAGPARGDLRRRHAARGAPGDPAEIEPDPHEPRHASRRDPPQPQEMGRLPREPGMGRRRRGAHLPRRLRVPRRQRAAAAAADRPRSTAPTRASCSPRRRSPTRRSWRSGWSARSSS